VIFPFEVEYFKKFGMEVEYSGNPLVDGVKDFQHSFKGGNSWRHEQGLDSRPVIALLAGSRKKEIQSMLPTMTMIAARHLDYQFVVAGAPSIEPEFYRPFLEDGKVKIVYGQTYSLLASARAALVTSGTATLEAALFEVPQVVLYRTSHLAYSIAKQIVKIKYISLVNLILNRDLVLEVIQKRLFSQTESELSRILDDASHREQITEGYKDLKLLIGEDGVSERVANRMVELIKEEKE